VIKTMFMYFCV